MIPATPDDITPSWLSAALAAAGFPVVRATTLERLGEDDSVTGFVYRVRLGFDGGTVGPAPSVVVKLPMSTDSRSEIFRQFYQREVAFYRELAPTLGELVPQAYFSEIDETSGDYVLILEDFPHLRPGRNDPPATGGEALTMVRQMATLHATWWNSPALHAHSFLGTEEVFIARMAGIVRDRLGTFMDRFEADLSPGLRRVYRAFATGFEAASEPLLHAPSTLVHHDLSLKNTLVGGTTDDHAIVLIDWQLVSAAPGVRDVSFFVENSVRPATGISEQELLVVYRDGLVERGVRDYSLAQLTDHYRRSVLVDLARVVAFGSQPTPRPMVFDIARHELAGRATADEDLALLELL